MSDRVTQKHDVKSSLWRCNISVWIHIALGGWHQVSDTGTVLPTPLNDNRVLGVIKFKFWVNSATQPNILAHSVITLTQQKIDWHKSSLYGGPHSNVEKCLEIYACVCVRCADNLSAESDCEWSVQSGITKRSFKVLRGASSAAVSCGTAWSCLLCAAR